MDNTKTIGLSTEHISLPWVWRPVKRRMLPGCELFADGDAFLHSARKFIPLEDGGDEKNNDISVDNEVIPCGAVGCSQTFTSLLGYENHYNHAHRHTCLTCHRAFPSAFLLDVHIQENHDPLFAILSTKQSMYCCLVESCPHKFDNPDNRRQHMIEVHRYPSNFRFHRLRPATFSAQCKKKQEGASRMDSSKQVVGSEIAETVQRPEKVGSIMADPEEHNMVTEDTAAGLIGSSQRTFVPKVPQKISFGHGVGRGFQRPHGKKKSKGKHWHQLGADSRQATATDIENINMSDMVHALEG